MEESSPTTPSSTLSETPRRTRSRTIYSDRFIPCRSSSNFALFHLTDSPNSNGNNSASVSGDSNADSPYKTLLKAALLGPECVNSPLITEASFRFDGGGRGSDFGQISPPNCNIFKYKTETRKRLNFLTPFELDDDLGRGVSSSPFKAPRKIPKTPHQVLDAPSLQDDYYLNLVDWSALNVLAVGLENCVYLLDVSSRKVEMLCDLGDNDSVCSVGWGQFGTQLAVGTKKGKLQLWDVSRCKRIRTIDGHSSRVSSLAWSTSLLSSGSKDETILQRDIRSNKPYVTKLSGHNEEVCGLKWSHDNRQLASGGNDNRLLVWNRHSTRPVSKFCEHTAAVKAIAWSPHVNGLLASGGGSADKCIRFWNTVTNSPLSCVDAESQVCNLVWSKNSNELVSTHGFYENHIIVWKYPTMSKLATLKGHTSRVLYLALSPDGEKIATGAGDETIRLWNVFPPLKRRNTERGIMGASSSHGRTYIR